MLRCFVGSIRLPGASAGNGVVTTGVERVTTAYSMYTEIATAKQAVLLNGLLGVVGATGVEAAALPEKRAQTEAIEAN